MRFRWRFAVIAITLLANNLVAPVTAQDGEEEDSPTPAPQDSSGDQTETPPTPVPASEEEETPAPDVEEIVPTPVPAVDEPTDPPDTPAPEDEDTPPTPSPVVEEEEEEDPATEPPEVDETPSPEPEETTPAETPAPVDEPEETEEPAPTPAPVEEPEEEAEPAPTPAPQEEEVVPPPTPTPAEEDSERDLNTPSPIPEPTEPPKETPTPVVPETPAPVTPAPVTPVPTPDWTFAPAAKWTESPGATLAPAREWTPPPSVAQTLAPIAPWTASPGATVAPAREWTPPPTVKQTWAPADPWTASPGATPAPARVWTPPPTVSQTLAPIAPWTASPGATIAPAREWTASPGATFAPAAPWTASPGATPPPTIAQTWAPIAPWTASPGATVAPAREWTPPPTIKQTWAPAAPWTASPGATPAPQREWTAPPTIKQTWAPVAPWTASPGATPAPQRVWTPPPTIKQTWAPVAPWTASPGATWAPVVPWTPPPSTAVREIPWTAPPTVPLLNLIATVEAANEEKGGVFEGSFDTVLAAFASADLTALLTGEALFTVFLPTDEAFASAGITTEAVASIPRPVLTNLLLYHLLEGAASSEVVSTATDFYTVLKVNLEVVDGGLVDGEGNARAMVGDEMLANNGYAHAVDGVLFPADVVTLATNVNAEGASFEGVFTIFLSALNRTGLISELSGINGPYTVLAPADFAFESIGITNETVLIFDTEILTTVLSYHVIQGEADNATLRETLQEFSTLLPNRTLSNSRDGGIIDATGQVANLLAADLQAVNGYVHAIDIVLEPYPLFTQSPTSAPTAAPTATPLLDLMETLEAENLDPTSKYFGQFDTILAALATSELDLELAEPNGPYTVFAPTDGAFLTANLGPDNVGNLPPSILENVLLYHMLAGGVRRAAIAADDTLYTALQVDLATSGATLIDSEGSTVNMVESDVACSNGYLHYVDGVLMPPDLMSSLETYNEPGGSYEGVFDTFMAAMACANMTDDVAGLHGPFTILAPTDSAFEVLRLNSSNICEANRTALEELLNYHIVDGIVGSAGMAEEGPLGTQGITVSSVGTMMGSQGGEATILAGDLSSSNGLVHAIDSVLMPFSAETLTGDMFPASDRKTPDGNNSNDHVEVAALSAGLVAALILVAAAIAVHKRRQADAAKPPQVAPDDGGWGGAGAAGRGASVHPA